MTDHLDLYFDRNGNPLSDVMDWADIRESEQRNVAITRVTEFVYVSTTYLGVRSNLGPPMIFETMIFGGPLNLGQWRWPTLDDAIAGHDMAVHVARLHARREGFMHETPAPEPDKEHRE